MITNLRRWFHQVGWYLGLVSCPIQGHSLSDKHLDDESCPHINAADIRRLPE